MKNGTYLNITKGKHRDLKYIRISAGPARNKYVHRLVAEALLRRRLRSNETVDHKDRNPANPDPTNLQVLSWSDHQKITLARDNKTSASIEGVDYVVILDGAKVFEAEGKLSSRHQWICWNPAKV